MTNQLAIRESFSNEYEWIEEICVSLFGNRVKDLSLYYKYVLCGSITDVDDLS